MMNDGSEDGKLSLTETEGTSEPHSINDEEEAVEVAEAAAEENVDEENEGEKEENEAKEGQGNLVDEGNEEEYREDRDENMDVNLAYDDDEGQEKETDTNSEENIERKEDGVMMTGDMDSKGGDAAHLSGSSSYTESSASSRNSRGKLFIGGLTRDTTTEMLTDHFKKYGEIIDSVIMKNRSTGHPRGFGFVTFSDPAVVDIVLRDSHVLDGKTVEAKRTVPRDGVAAPSRGPKTKKIFVGGLKTSTTEEEFKRFFEKFGKIVECQVMQDHSTGRSRGFGFVTYDSEQSVENALTQGRMHELDGKQVEIKKAEPKRGDEAPLSQSYDRSSHRRGRGGSSYDGNTGFYGSLNGVTPPYYGSGSGGPSRGSNGRLGSGYSPYGASYGYGGGYGGFYGYGDIDDKPGGMAYNYTGYGPGSGSSYANMYGGGGYGVNGGGYGVNGGGYGVNGGGYGVNGGGYGGSAGYGGSGRGYSGGRYHPYSRP